LSRDGSMLLINGVLTKFLHPSSFWDICCGRKWKFLLSRPSLHSRAINRLNPCLGEIRRIKKHYARIHKPQFRFPMKNRKPPYCLPEDKAQVQFKAMYQLGPGEIRYQQLLTNGSLSMLTSSLSTPCKQRELPQVRSHQILHHKQMQRTLLTLSTQKDHLLPNQQFNACNTRLPITM